MEYSYSNTKSVTRERNSKGNPMYNITVIDGVFHLVCAETLETTGIFADSPEAIERDQGLTYDPSTDTFDQ